MIKSPNNIMLLLIIGFTTIILGSNTNAQNEFFSNLPTNNTRTWIGPEYWANPLQDWQLNNGQIECIISGGRRNVFLLTHEIGQQVGNFSISINAKDLNPVQPQNIAAPSQNIVSPSQNIVSPSQNIASQQNITSKAQGWIGFEIGIKGESDDYRSSAIRGHGFPIGITTDGRLFIGKIDSTQKPIPNFSMNEITIKIQATQQDNGDYFIELIAVQTQNIASQQNTTVQTQNIAVQTQNIAVQTQNIASLQQQNIPSHWIEGNIALMCHSGSLMEFADERKRSDYHVWGYNPQQKRGGNINYGFSDWKISGDKITVHKNRAFGPILFSQYTLSNGILKMTAQMPPIGKKDGQIVALQTKSGNNWKTIAEAPIDSLSRTATFKIENWDTSKDTPYRLKYHLSVQTQNFASPHTIQTQTQDIAVETQNFASLRKYYHKGTIRKEPLHKNEIIVAAFTGNNDLGFPNNDIFESVKYHDPDLLFFSGDQIYEGVGGYGAQRAPFDKSCLDYLRKWYLYGWAYGDLMRDRPTIAIPDDHDVYHGNIWGNGGIATPPGFRGSQAQDAGGYKMPPGWVKMVERTQTAHLPDAYDPTPVAQDIGVYYTNMNYGGISFAIIEDRKFKSAPKPLLPQAKINNGWAQNKEFDASTQSDVEGAVLLGQRQLDFLEQWSADWSQNIWMKVVLSQTIFANVATLPYADSHSDVIVPKLRILNKGEYPPDDVVVADFDSDGWPQTGRNKALTAMRKSFAFHIAGDQHLGSTIQYGINDWHDAGYAFCVPAISNVWPRRWCPAKSGQNRTENMPKYAGDFKDGFGNKMSVYAASNPVSTGQEPAKLYDRATGYGIIRFKKDTRDIIMECWPRQANPEIDEQYQGWPITINQQDNYLGNAKLFLPEIIVTGIENPIIQVIDELDNKIVFTLRMKGKTYQPKVMKEGNYTIKIGETGSGKMKIIENISPEKNGGLDPILISF